MDVGWILVDLGVDLGMDLGLDVDLRLISGRLLGWILDVHRGCVPGVYLGRIFGGSWVGRGRS